MRAANGAACRRTAGRVASVRIELRQLRADCIMALMFSAAAVRPFNRYMPQRGRRAVFVVLLAASAAAPAAAQTGAAGSQQEPSLRFQLPTLIVTAQKQPEDKQTIPVSVTAVSRRTLESAGIQIVSDAAIYAPNTFFTEFTARKLSNARFRGIGASPNNPSITTYVDGVPQLSANSSSVELLDVDQVEFVRGPQSALFGRNTLGGLVNVTSVRPSAARWTGQVSVPFGNFESRAVRGSASGP